MIAALILLFLVVLLVLRIPIGFALIVAGSVGLTVTSGWEAAYGVLKTAPLTTTGIYELITVPMFLLMAEFVVASGIADDLFRSAAIWIGRVRGGLAIATALAGAGFAAISGSSTASAATLSSTSLPAMIKHEYRDSLAAGVVSISGTLAMLIPPSIAVIVYGLIAEESIGKLLIACVIPGLVVTAAIILTVMLIGWMEPGSMPRGQSFTLREKLRSSKVALPMILLFLAVTGIIYFGIATPTEASSLGAFGAFLLALASRKLNRDIFVKAVRRATRISCMIMTIVLGAQFFGYFFAMTRTTVIFSEFVMGLGLPDWGILIAVLCLLLILGCFLDGIAILVLTVPTLLPLMKGLGYDPIWFGVMVILTVEIGMVTPPLGMNVFVVSRVTGIPLQTVFKGVWPHVLAHVILLALFTIFPGLILWLPETM